MYFNLYDLEGLMRKILATAGLAFSVVFMAGVIFGWWYGLFLGLVILLAMYMVDLANRRS